MSALFSKEREHPFSKPNGSCPSQVNLNLLLAATFLNVTLPGILGEN